MPVAQRAGMTVIREDEPVILRLLAEHYRAFLKLRTLK